VQMPRATQLGQELLLLLLLSGSYLLLWLVALPPSGLRLRHGLLVTQADGVTRTGSAPAKSHSTAALDVLICWKLCGRV
jgi:hypothetical protein